MPPGSAIRSWTGSAATSPGPRRQRAVDDGRGAVRGLPGRRRSRRRQDRHGPGAGSYPWNDSSAFAAVSVEPEHPYTVVSYLEKAGFGSTGAAPVVKCMFLALSGMHRRSTRCQSPSRSTTSDEVPARPPDVDTRCMRAPTPARSPPELTTPMALSMLQRKPDSGLGNIRSSPADPSRNIDWVLLLAQSALTVVGCFIVFSATRTRTADPYTFVTRQVIFAIAAAVAMVVVMAIDYEWLKGTPARCTC